jgi:SHS2 domain-containing protein
MRMSQIIEESKLLHKIDIYPALIDLRSIIPKRKITNLSNLLKKSTELCILNNMIKDSKAGFEEVSHTADLEIKVWGKDMVSLFRSAVAGMFHLSGIEDLEQGVSAVKQNITLDAMDYEGLLILFLEELLYRLTEDYMLYEVGKLSISSDFSLKAQLKGNQISSYQRDIKAVTYHNLNIRTTPEGYEVNIVFDI